jgi:hypothetical protein
MEYKFPGNTGAFSAMTQETDVTLRLVVQGQTTTGYYAFATGEWQRFGKIGNYLANPTICLGVSNVDSAGTRQADLVGRFDYVEVSRP